MDELDRMAARLGEEEHNIRSKTLMSKLYRLSGSAKVKAAEEHLGSLLEEGVLSLAVLQPFQDWHHAQQGACLSLLSQSRLTNCSALQLLSWKILGLLQQ